MQILGEVLAAAKRDLPNIHRIDPQSATPSGVYRTSNDCYDLLVELLPECSSTLETGLGISTILFAAAGTRHTAVFVGSHEAAGLKEWCGRHRVDLDQVELLDEPSDQALPRLTSGPPLDLVFIDGCHGYPFPQLDWYYACQRLRDGGTVVVDDVQLGAPKDLADFLDADPRWKQLARTDKWAAYIRTGFWAMAEEWDSQTFYAPPGPSKSARAVAALRRRASGAIRRAKKLAAKRRTR